MRALLLAAAVCIATAAAHWQPAVFPPPTPNGIKAFPPVWPKPAVYTYGLDGVIIDAANVQMVAANGANADLTAAFGRFTARAFDHVNLPTTNVSLPVVSTITIAVADYNAELQLYMNENYTLTVNATHGVHIAAGTNYGAYHALESLSQMTGFDFDMQQFVVRHTPWVVVDYPRFPHRGVLLDTSRHFEPLKTIRMLIDSLTYAKFNALHWHIVDAQSFGYDSVSYPKLGKASAWAPEQRFTQNDVRSIVDYGRQRGIRVMVELDTPGHSASMCNAYPEMCPDPLCPSANVNNWALDITKNVTYEIIEALWTEFAGLFPEKMSHIGGDEVDYYCWSIHPRIMQWLETRNMTLTDGFLYYVKHIQDFIWKQFPDRLVVGWQEIWDHFGTRLSKKTIIQQWLPNSVALPLNVTSHGYRLVWSDSSRWYLDHLDVTWTDMYTAEPCNGLPDANCALILGGEACQWGETVDTSDAMQTIWPRAGAVAERLWSPRDTTDLETANTRLFGFRCLLNRRGIAAAPVNNTVARDAPVGPGSCYWQ